MDILNGIIYEIEKYFFFNNAVHNSDHAEERKVRNLFNILFTIPIVNFIQISKTFSTEIEINVIQSDIVPEIKKLSPTLALKKINEISRKPPSMTERREFHQSIFCCG